MTPGPEQAQTAHPGARFPPSFPGRPPMLPYPNHDAPPHTLRLASAKRRASSSNDPPRWHKIRPPPDRRPPAHNADLPAHLRPQNHPRCTLPSQALAFLLGGSVRRPERPLHPVGEVRRGLGRQRTDPARPPRGAGRHHRLRQGTGRRHEQHPRVSESKRVPLPGAPPPAWHPPRSAPWATQPAAAHLLGPGEARHPGAGRQAGDAVSALAPPGIAALPLASRLRHPGRGRADSAPRPQTGTVSATSLCARPTHAPG